MRLINNKTSLHRLSNSPTTIWTSLVISSDYCSRYTAWLTLRYLYVRHLIKHYYYWVGMVAQRVAPWESIWEVQGSRARVSPWRRPLSRTSLIKILASSCLGQPSLLHPSRVNKSSISFGWRYGGNVASVGWQLKLCDPIWHMRFPVVSRRLWINAHECDSS